MPYGEGEEEDHLLLTTMSRNREATSHYPSKIRLLSFNCWGLKYISKYRHERLKEIGAQIAKSDPPPDIACLQECWTQQDYQSIRAQTKHILPFGKFYYSGIFGGGLAVLSKWPIEESSMFRYPLNGRPTAFWRGDWYVGKGVACARIRLGPSEEDFVQIFNTHVSHKVLLFEAQHLIQSYIQARVMVSNMLLLSSTPHMPLQTPAARTWNIEHRKHGRFQSSCVMRAREVTL